MKTLNSKNTINSIKESFKKACENYVNNTISPNKIEAMEEEIRSIILKISNNQIEPVISTDRITGTINVSINPYFIMKLEDGQRLQLHNIPKYKSFGLALYESLGFYNLTVVCASCEEKLTYSCDELNNVFEDFGELCCTCCGTPWLEFSYEK